MNGFPPTPGLANFTRGIIKSLDDQERKEKLTKELTYTVQQYWQGHYGLKFPGYGVYSGDQAVAFFPVPKGVLPGSDSIEALLLAKKRAEVYCYACNQGVAEGLESAKPEEDANASA